MKEKQSGEPRRLRSANIHEIAKLSGVSIASVSRALNGEPGVGKATAGVIEGIAAELGYYPNSSARALVTGRSRNVGLLISDIGNPFFAELLREFEEEAVSKKYEVIVANINNDPRRIQQSARRLLERKVDGVAFMTAEQSPLLSELRERQIPMVLLESGRPSAYVSVVKIDALTGMIEAVRHLYSLGHRRIGFLGARVSLAPGALRLQAFHKALEMVGLTAAASFVSVENEPTIKGGQDGMVEMLCRRKRPTGILVFNDGMALGALQAARLQGVSVPRDCSIIGFDNIELGAYAQPELTTIQCSRPEMARFAFHSLYEMSRGAAGKSILLRTSLLLRGSTAAVPRTPQRHID